MTNWQRDDNFKALKAKNANFAFKTISAHLGYFTFSVTMYNHASSIFQNLENNCIQKRT